MLSELKIEQLAIIEDLNVNFNQNMTALTGQTGAGKSLLIDSLKLLFGARADQDLIRHGSEEASVTGVFRHLNQPLKDLLKLMDIEDEVLTISRIISKTSKNNIIVNHKQITLNELKRIAYLLGDIHEQHDITKLLDPKLQLSLIDQMNLKKIEPLYNQYQLTKATYLLKEQKYKQACLEQQSQTEALEQLKDIKDELEKFKLDETEKETLQNQIEKLSHQEKIVLNVNSAFEILDDLYQKGDLYEAADALKVVSGFDSLYADASAKIRDIYFELEGLRSDLKRSLSVFDYFSEAELDALIERMQAIVQLEKKYKKTVPELIDYLKEIDEKILMTEDYAGYLSKLKDDLDKAHQTVIKAGQALSKVRRELAKSLEKALTTELNLLDLEQVQFEIRFDENQAFNLYDDGLDTVTFNISLNKGEPLKPLYKTASGGELSRFMLALKIVFATYQQINLVVFDEIDMGISGKTASKVAKRIHNLSNHVQVLSITHLPQVAAIADHHYHIEKQVIHNRTITHITILNESKRIEILAEMLSGDRIDAYAIEHAKALLEK